MSALTRALKDRWTDELKGLVHHSGPVGPYAAIYYADCPKNHNIRISISRKGNLCDNAIEETFIKVLQILGGVFE